MPEGPATTLLRKDDRPVAIEVRGFEVAVLEGADAGRRALASRRSFIVGTHESSDLRLCDPHVSRHHFRIDVGDNDYSLRDLGSTNGTRLGAVRVRDAVLETGALIECGETRLQFNLLAATTYASGTALHLYEPQSQRAR